MQRKDLQPLQTQNDLDISTMELQGLYSYLDLLSLMYDSYQQMVDLYTFLDLLVHIFHKVVTFETLQSLL